MAPTLDDVLRAVDSPDVRKTLLDTFLDFLSIDNTVGPDIASVRANEAKAFEMICTMVERIRGSREGLEFLPIDPKIEGDPYYTPCHYTKTPERPEGLGAAATYKDRKNLVLRLPGQGKGTVAFNSHIDVVSPYIPPTVEGGIVHGRGSCDDKGGCAVQLLTLFLIEEARKQLGIVPPADLIFEFVIDEEPGGNGSMSLALDHRFAFDVLAVLEITELKVHPGNRGAVWYKLVLDGSVAPGLDLVGLATACVLGMEEEGAKIKAESDHPLFPHRPVQTCHGILGQWGKHPSAVNDHTEIALTFAQAPDPAALQAVVDQAVVTYCGIYGDKTQEPDEETGKPKVDHHYDLSVDGTLAKVVIHGKAGHMGATVLCDNAITKTAFVLDAIEKSDLGLTAMSTHVEEPDAPLGTLVLEGGQGFVPTHTLNEVTDRMEQAIERGAKAYCEKHGVAYDPKLTTTTFEKLHNDAFARDADSPGVRAFVEAARAAGVPVEEPLKGWDVSCDARIFAREYPDADIITFGAGTLHHAHSADEQVKIDDLVLAAKALAQFALTYAPRG